MPSAPLQGGDRVTTWRALEEAFDRLKSLPLLPEPVHMVRPGQLQVERAGDALSQIPCAGNGDEHVVDPVDDQSGVTTRGRLSRTSTSRCMRSELATAPGVAANRW